MPCRHIIAAFGYFHGLHEVYFEGKCSHLSYNLNFYPEAVPIRSPIDQELNTTDLSAPERTVLLERYTANKS